MYQSKIKLGYVALNVLDIERQSLFYQKVIGLDVLEAKEKIVRLGVGDKELVRLIKTAQNNKVSETFGLYHLAILLPNRQELGKILKFFVDNKIPLVGGSDHHYSEAIYLEDIEGNGIEIYCDRPIEHWNILEDGRIIGTTEPLDANGLLSMYKEVISEYKLPIGSSMGHVHLSVKDSELSANLFNEIFDLSIKFGVPSAKWIASGNYHHHIAMNEWAKGIMSTRKPDMLGLAYFTIEYTDPKEYQRVIEKIEQQKLELKKLENGVEITVYDGIAVRVILN